MSRARVGHVYEAQFNRIGPDGSLPWIGHVLILEERGRNLGGLWKYDVLVTDDSGEMFTIDDYCFRQDRMKRIT